MWDTKKTQLTGGYQFQVITRSTCQPVSYAEIIQLWQDSSEFRSFFVDQLTISPYSAFRWETPPITIQNSDRPFEFVILDSPNLARRPDLAAFQEHFSTSVTEDVIVFSNLGRDAMMVVPTPSGTNTGYCHLASFLETAPDSQQHRLWQQVGKAMQARVSDKPVWLSTAGGGVAWLHVRLDDRPKYYRHAAYLAYP